MKTLTKLSLLLTLTILALFCSCTKPNNGGNNGNGGSSNLTDTTYYDVSYGTHQRHVYDVHLPAKRDSNTPIVFMLHGGAWKAGKKEDMNSFVNVLKNKWPDAAIVNSNYRLASNTNNIHHTEIMTDINAAIAHVVSNQQQYQISTNFGIMGASAGGHLSMINALTENPNGYIKCIGNIFGPSNLRDWSWYNSNNIWLGGNVGTIIAEYVGQTWDSTVYSNLSPRWVADSSSLPIIIFHGNLDPIVPVYQSKNLRNRLSSLQVPHAYHEYIAFHDFNATQKADAMTKLTAFFKLYLN